MPASLWLLAGSLVVGIILSGCSGSKAEANLSPEPSSTASATGTSSEGTGSIQGSVVDDQIVPIGGAQVGITKPISLQATTAADGSFVFAGLAPGSYDVVAQKLGYQSVAKSVTVGADAARITLTLVPLAVETSYHETLPVYSGFIGCAFVRPGVQGYVGSTTYDYSSTCEPVTGARKNAFDFKLSAANLHSVVGETRWQPAVVGSSSSLQTFFTHSKGSGTHWWCSGSGRTPTSFIWSIDENVTKCFDHGSSKDEPLPTTKLTLRTEVFLPFTKVNPSQPTNTDFIDVALQQKYETIVSIFYGEAPPAGFTAFVDG